MSLKIPLHTQRLILREYQEDDFPSVHEFASDPDTVKFMTWGPNTTEETRSFIKMAVSSGSIQPRSDYYLAVLLRQRDRIIGGCGVHLRDPGQCSAVIGYGFNKVFWGQGFATETVQALIRFGFETLGLHRITATCDSRNLASARVLEKNGMRREAFFIKHLWQKGEWRDSYLYAILDEEWPFHFA